MDSSVIVKVCRQLSLWKEPGESANSFLWPCVVVPPQAEITIMSVLEPILPLTTGLLHELGLDLLQRFVFWEYLVSRVLGLVPAKEKRSNWDARSLGGIEVEMKFSLPNSWHSKSGTNGQTLQYQWNQLRHNAIYDFGQKDKGVDYYILIGYEPHDDVSESDFTFLGFAEVELPPRCNRIVTPIRPIYHTKWDRFRKSLSQIYWEIQLLGKKQDRSLHP